MIMPPDFAKVEDAQPTVGGKRWGLRFKDGLKMWHCFTDAPDCTDMTNWALSFDTPLDAERYRLRMVVNRRTNCKVDNFEVADLDTGEVVPPDDPRLQPPTVDSDKPAKPGSMGYVLRVPNTDLYYDFSHVCQVNGNLYTSDAMKASRFPSRAWAENKMMSHCERGGCEVVDLATLRAVDEKESTVDSTPNPVPPGKVRVTSGEFAGKVGRHLYTSAIGNVYCIIDGVGVVMPSGCVAVGPPAEDDDTGSDESDDAESQDDEPADNQFYIPSSDVCDLAHALSVGVSANAAGDTLTVAQAFGRIEGLLSVIGILDLHEGEDESC